MHLYVHTADVDVVRTSLAKCYHSTALLSPAARAIKKVNSDNEYKETWPSLKHYDFKRNILSGSTVCQSIMMWTSILK